MSPQIKLQTKRCRTCGARGLGPGAVKLHPFEGFLYCATDFRAALAWHEDRDRVTMTVENQLHYDEAVHSVLRQSEWVGWLTRATSEKDWEPYIRDLCGLVEFGLLHDNKKIFTRYFALALYAWELKGLPK